MTRVIEFGPTYDTWTFTFTCSQCGCKNQGTAKDLALHSGKGKPHHALCASCSAFCEVLVDIPNAVYVQILGRKLKREEEARDKSRSGKLPPSQSSRLGAQALCFLCCIMALPAVFIIGIPYIPAKVGYLQIIFVLSCALILASLIWAYNVIDA